MPNTITISDAAQAFLSYLKENGRSERTLYTYGKDLEQIRAFFSDDKELGSILRTQVGKFMRSEALLKLPNGKFRAPRTIKKTYLVFCMLLKWGKEQGYLDELPIPKEFNLDLTDLSH